MRTLSIETTAREQLRDITREVSEAVATAGVSEGAVIVQCPHTTAGVTMNEAADPDVARDIVIALREAVPRHGDYRHGEGNSDAHVKASLVGSSVMVPIVDRRLALGTWQGVFFCEFDGPRQRTVNVTVIKGTDAH